MIKLNPPHKGGFFILFSSFILYNCGMEKKITIDDMDYMVTDEERIDQSDELIFEIRERRDMEHTFVVGMWDDLLGSPIQKVWKILGKKLHHDEYYEIGGSE
jgi:hypothetical protein